MNVDQLIKQGTFERHYRKCTTQSSLNPAIAFTMNILTGLDKNDRILDPCCGSATILIERQLLKPATCIGVDLDPRALDCARENIDAAKVEVELKHGDIKEKKFSDNYFTKIISNLPFGIHTGSRKQNIGLYQFLADGAIRWLKSGGKAIFLTNSKSLLRNAFAHNPAWELVSEIPLETGGLHLVIFIYQKL